MIITIIRLRWKFKIEKKEAKQHLNFKPSIEIDEMKMPFKKKFPFNEDF